MAPEIETPAAEVIRRTPEAQYELIGAVLEAECDRLFQAAFERRAMIHIPQSLRSA